MPSRLTFGAERQRRCRDAAQHGIRRGDAIGLPAEPAIHHLAGSEFRRVAFEDLADGEARMGVPSGTGAL